MLRVPYNELLDTLQRVLLKLGFAPDRARLCARLFADANRDGVYSHGLNRFPRFVLQIQNGTIDIHAEPQLLAGMGALERWDGKIGPGPLNAFHCMERAIALSRKNGIGCVALANTTHWMRGGNYGWQAAEAGVIGICWTNTMPNLPPWGASDARVGNNPLIIAVPRPAGHVVLDMAVSQFSYGALASYRMRHELLPVDGGFDAQGQLTRDPAAIEASMRPLPIGFWKGSGLALMMDMVAALLAGGKATHQIPPDSDRENRMSQLFIAADPASFGPSEIAAKMADDIIAHFQLPPGSKGERVRYPGEQVLKIRSENLAKGIPVEPSIWQKVQAM
ncbi:MAG TPA: 3-dehydro-L-gulonate 2-dehydrogenase [Terriglobales bacterium]|nr:3-dehydro-L-gulonate 2-dehydrogenase [Terriglobales bacterium]